MRVKGFEPELIKQVDACINNSVSASRFSSNRGWVRLGYQGKEIITELVN